MAQNEEGTKANDTSVCQDLVFGIDFGTTNSVIYFFDKKTNNSGIVTTPSGKRNFKSCVAVNSKGEYKVGEQALNTQKNNRTKKLWQLVTQTKTGLGIYEMDEQQRVQLETSIGHKIQNIKGMPHVILEFKEEGEKIVIEKKFDWFKVCEASAFREAIERAFPQTKDKKIQCVCCFPARFTHSQREATQSVLSINKMEAMRMITEPTAAALHYMIEAKKNGIKLPTESEVLVFDFGGGTLDFTIAELDSENLMAVVQKTQGDTKLGGHDIDDLVREDIARIFCERYKVPLKELHANKEAMRKITVKAEQVKITLNSGASNSCDLDIEALHNGEDLFDADYTYQAFEKCTRSIRDRVLDILDNKLMKQENKSPADIDKVLLVGGSSRIKYFSQELEKRFPGKIISTLDRDECVAMGALEMAKILVGGEAGSDVAPLLLDVIPFSMCIETAGNVATVLAAANTTVPITKEMTFTNYADNQEFADINICEGEFPQFSDNPHLLNFRVPLTPGRRGTCQIQVKIHVNESMITEVSAKDLVKNVEEKGTVTRKTHLSPEEQAKYHAEVAANKETNDKVRALITKRGEITNTIHQVLNMLETAPENVKTQFADKKNDAEVLLTKLNSKTDLKQVANNHFDADSETATKLLSEINAAMSGGAAAAAAPSDQPVVEEAD